MEPMGRQFVGNLGFRVLSFRSLGLQGSGMGFRTCAVHTRGSLLVETGLLRVFTFMPGPRDPK